MSCCVVCLETKEVSQLREVLEDNKEQLVQVLKDVDLSVPMPPNIKWCGSCRVDLVLIFSVEGRPSPRKKGKYTKAKRPPRLQKSAFQYALWKREKLRSKTRNDCPQPTDSPDTLNFSSLRACAFCENSMPLTNAASATRIDSQNDLVQNSALHYSDTTSSKTKMAAISPLTNTYDPPTAGDQSTSIKLYSLHSLFGKTSVDRATLAQNFRERRMKQGENFRDSFIKDMFLIFKSCGNHQTRQALYACNMHYQAIQSSIKDLSLVKCALCCESVTKQNSVRLGNLFTESDDKSKLIAIETISAILSFNDSDSGESNNKDARLSNDKWLESVFSRLATSDEDYDDDDGDLQSESLANVFSDSEKKALRFLSECSGCFKCYSSLQRKCQKLFNSKLQNADRTCRAGVHTYSQNSHEKSFPDTAMRTVVSGIESKLCSDVGITELAKVVYETYVLEFRTSAQDKKEIPKCMRTFMRTIFQKTDLVIVRSNIRGEGSILMSKETARSFMLQGKRQNDQPAYEFTCQLSELLGLVSSRYKDSTLKEKYQKGDWNVIEEMKAIGSIIWRHFWILTESTRDRMHRRSAETRA